MMRTLVTGGLGFIGSHLVDRLTADGHLVTILDKHPTRSVPQPDAAVIRARVQDSDHPLADIVYHLAGPVGPVGVLHRAGRITMDVLEMAAWLRPYVSQGVPVVFVSTSEVYGEQPTPIAESAPRIIAAGHSARMEYATSKLAAETMLLEMDGDVRIVRPFNVAGPRQRSEGGFVLPRFLEQVRRGEPLTVYRPGTQRRAFTHVLDIVDGIVRAGRTTRHLRQTVWNLGNPANECSIVDLAERVLDVTGTVGSIEVVDPVDLWGPAFREAPDKVPDITRAREGLGWTPTRDLSTVIWDAWMTVHS